MNLIIDLNLKLHLYFVRQFLEELNILFNASQASGSVRITIKLCKLFNHYIKIQWNFYTFLNCLFNRMVSLGYSKMPIIYIFLIYGKNYLDRGFNLPKYVIRNLVISIYIYLFSVIKNRSQGPKTKNWNT